MNDRRTQVWIVGIFLAVIIGITAIAAISSKGSAGSVPFNGAKTAAISSTDHVRGPQNAKVSVIEYGDFQCPACGAYEPIVQQLEHNYASSSVEFVFRNYPLPQHANAPITAQAAEAAALQGKYWEMHDLLYEKQNEWSDAASDKIKTLLDGYAQSISLNVAKFDADLQSDAVKQKVQNDQSLGNQASVDHTPTFFVNLTEIKNPSSYDEFKAALDAALASSQQ